MMSLPEDLSRKFEEELVVLEESLDMPARSRASRHNCSNSTETELMIGSCSGRSFKPCERQLHRGGWTAQMQSFYHSTHLP